MKTIVRQALDDRPTEGEAAVSARDPWRAIARRCDDWVRGESIVWRDAVVLVPFLEMLAPARRAFARLGAWMPRIETTQTLAASLGPPSNGRSESGFDAALDTLVAMQSLARQPWGAEWSRRDPRGFEHGCRRLVACTHDLGRGCARGGDRTSTRLKARPASGSREPGGG